MKEVTRSVPHETLPDRELRACSSRTAAHRNCSEACFRQESYVQEDSKDADYVTLRYDPAKAPDKRTSRSGTNANASR